MLDDAIKDTCSADPLRLAQPDEASHSGAVVAAPHQPTYWPMGSSNGQRQRGWIADPTPSGIQFTLPGLSSLLVPNRVQRPIQQHSWVLPPHSVPQSDGAGDQSSEDMSFLDKDDVMSLLATGGLGDEADSQQHAPGEDEVEEIQPQVPYVVFVFLARMRALVVRRRRHQHGAVADSLALDSCRKRMLERAVIARFAKGKTPPLRPTPLSPPPPPGQPAPTIGPPLPGFPATVLVSKLRHDSCMAPSTCARAICWQPKCTHIHWSD